MSVTGYAHPLYARSLAEFGEPLKLPHSSGWLLRRNIPGTIHSDAMGCYPLFCCVDWPKLEADLVHLPKELVTVVLALDPFAPTDSIDLKASFDLIKPFKEHFIVDVFKPTEAHVSNHHRYYARKSLREIRVEMVVDPMSHLDEWTGLYDSLIDRHKLNGVKAFSKKAFEMQFGVPGLVMFRALLNDRVVGSQLWFVNQNVAYSHLTALSELGYQMRAAYGLYWVAIETIKRTFSNQLQWIDLGAGAGLTADGKDGLTEFKRGWTNTTRTKYLCGRILDSEVYAELARSKRIAETMYFPAYRMGEF